MISLVNTAGKARALVVGGACAVMLAAGSGAFAYASSASSTPAAATSAPRVLKACMPYGSNTMIYDWNGAACPSGHYQTSWNQTGPQGETGERGPQGPAGTPIDYASTGNNSPYLAIDQAPGPDGSGGTGGWGWDQAGNKAITDLKVGTDANFVVTAIQPGSGSHGTGDYTVTLTYSPYDFKLVSESGVGPAIPMGDASGTVSYTVSNNGHADLSTGFVFTPLHANPDASVGVTVTSDANGQATAQFPVSIRS